MKIEFRHGIYVRIANALTIELGWFNQNWTLLNVKILELDDSAFEFDKTFFLCILRIQILKLSFDIHLSWGVYNA